MMALWMKSSVTWGKWVLTEWTASWRYNKKDCVEEVRSNFPTVNIAGWPTPIHCQMYFFKPSWCLIKSWSFVCMSVCSSVRLLWDLNSYRSCIYPHTFHVIVVIFNAFPSLFHLVVCMKHLIFWWCDGLFKKQRQVLERHLMLMFDSRRIRQLPRVRESCSWSFNANAIYARTSFSSYLFFVGICSWWRQLLSKLFCMVSVPSSFCGYNCRLLFMGITAVFFCGYNCRLLSVGISAVFFSWV